MTKSTPPVEVVINTDLVHALLREQAPEFADLPMEWVSSGWDCEIHRLGEHHAARLPRRSMSAVRVENEHRWLPELAPSLPLPVPVPVHAGTPALGFTWPWSIVPWLRGIPLAHSPALDSERLIADLAGFLNALHVAAPEDAPDNPVRGTPLTARDASTRRTAREAEGIDAPAVIALWDELVKTPAWGSDPIWIHGDLHPLNMLVWGGRISGIIDWIDLSAGDPATDLAVAWMLFDADDRDAFRDALRIDGHRVGIHTWDRARGWALSLAVTFVAHSGDDPTLRRLGRTTLDQVLA